MTVDELHAWLLGNGYAEWTRRQGARISLYDFYLDRIEDLYRIHIVERGEIIDQCLDTRSEAEACAWFVQQVTNCFLVFASDDLSEVQEKKARLESAGIALKSKNLPGFDVEEDARYRLFVAGSDLKRARDLITPPSNEGNAPPRMWGVGKT